MYGSEDGFPNMGKFSSLFRKGRREEGGQEGTAGETESHPCRPARTILSATPLHGYLPGDGYSVLSRSPPTSELLASSRVSLGLKQRHFVFPRASQLLHLVPKQRVGNLFQGWRGGSRPETAECPLQRPLRYFVRDFRRPRE